VTVVVVDEGGLLLLLLMCRPRLATWPAHGVLTMRGGERMRLAAI